MFSMISRTKKKKRKKKEGKREKEKRRTEKKAKQCMMEIGKSHTMFRESAIQNATKFFQVHCRRSGSTGSRSWLINIS